MLSRLGEILLSNVRVGSVYVLDDEFMSLHRNEEESSGNEGK